MLIFILRMTILGWSWVLHASSMLLNRVRVRAQGPCDHWVWGAHRRLTGRRLWDPCVLTGHNNSSGSLSRAHALGAALDRRACERSSISPSLQGKKLRHRDLLRAYKQSTQEVRLSEPWCESCYILTWEGAPAQQASKVSLSPTH